MNKLSLCCIPCFVLFACFLPASYGGKSSSLLSFDPLYKFNDFSQLFLKVGVEPRSTRETEMIIFTVYFGCRK